MDLISYLLNRKNYIYKILDIQATLPDSEIRQPNVKKEIKPTSKKQPTNLNSNKTSNPKESPSSLEKKDRTSKLLESLDLNLKSSDKKENQIKKVANTLIELCKS